MRGKFSVSSGAVELRVLRTIWESVGNAIQDRMGFDGFYKRSPYIETPSDSLSAGAFIRTHEW